MSDQVYFYLMVFVLVAAIMTAITVTISPAPYGKQDRRGFGPGINMRTGWFILELPAFAFMLYFYLAGNHRLDIGPLILFSVFQIHYFHRTFIYPFQIRPKRGANYRIILLVIGVFFNSANGALNGWFLSSKAAHLYTADWLSDPRFLVGMGMFIGGALISKWADRILRNLRAPGEEGYKIPYGGPYRFISCPNYFGEMVQWAGFAIAGWSMPAAAFLFFTAANLIPKAVSSHKWYLRKFADYPKDRAAVFPFIL